MDNTQHTYFAELKLALQKAGYTVQPVDCLLYTSPSPRD